MNPRQRRQRLFTMVCILASAILIFLSSDVSPVRIGAVALGAVAFVTLAYDTLHLIRRTPSAR